MDERDHEEVLEDVRLCVYRSLSDTGRLPSGEQLAAIAGGAGEVEAAIAELARRRAWALGPCGAIELAHPFGTRSFGYSVMSDTTLWWGGCCWDAFAIPHLVPGCDSAIVAGACPACGRAMAWRVDTDEPPAGPERAHFLVPMKHVWDDVLHTCSNQRLFCDDDCLDAWLEATGNTEGYRMDLSTLWRFAARWYEGRLDRGYVRREPSDALAYFADVGLHGSFWGLPDAPQSVPNR